MYQIRPATEQRVHSNSQLASLLESFCAGGPYPFALLFLLCSASQCFASALQLCSFAFVAKLLPLCSFLLAASQTGGCSGRSLFPLGLSKMPRDLRNPSMQAALGSAWQFLAVLGSASSAYLAAT